MSISSTTSKLDAAMNYLERGLALLPIGLDKRPYWDLLPMNRNGNPVWKPLAVNPVGKKEVEDWFRRDPECNLGIITGSPSGGILVADFDREPPKGLHMPPTPRVVTARCFHSYFRSKTPVKSRRIAWGDIKADGGYCVLPPSIHPTGHIYRWAELLSPDDVDFADCPTWLNMPSPKQRERSSSREYSLLDDLPPHPAGLQGHALGAWDADEDFVLAACEQLDIPVFASEDIGKAFRCVLPGHTDEHPSASLYRREDGLIVYHDWHRASGEEWYYLAEVRAAKAYGQVIKINRPEMATWHLRLLVESGFVSPIEIDFIPLPARARPAMCRIYNGFLLLLGCKWLHTYGAPTPFSWRFASAWCGVSVRRVGDAMQELLRIGLIVPAGKENGLQVFLPGKGK